MKLHNLKIKAEFATQKLSGNKPFEIRKNDRNFKVNDLIKYTCIDSPIVNDDIEKSYIISLISRITSKKTVTSYFAIKRWKNDVHTRTI